HSVKEDPTLPGLLYLGTERGVDVSRDDGASWHSLKLNLPTVAVHDLVVKDDSLVLATHGRSFWIFDHLAALRAISPAVLAADLALLPPPPSVRWVYADGEPQDRWSGANPPHGSRFYYWLKDEPKGDVTVEVLDSKGA